MILPVIDDPALAQNDDPNISARAITPEKIVCSLPEALPQNETPMEQLAILGPSCSSRTSLIVSPQALKPLPKAPPQEKKVTKGNKKKKFVDDEEDEKEEEDYCLVCLSPYSTSKSREVWIQCQDCKLWAHEACTPGLPNYICQNCNRDKTRENITPLQLRRKFHTLTTKKCEWTIARRAAIGTTKEQQFEEHKLKMRQIEEKHAQEQKFYEEKHNIELQILQLNKEKLQLDLQLLKRQIEK
ncbi:hypothetical protein EVAR_10671_1 [Eumeta japonica]|uniref:Uncharacterized protein n=1 Tax=Eumeta variegata TaxID=151549 RepID=A0A4C1U768_EUMVA|nr:hypothetical protein EVAR_10671_1 [Eumeta japonica]